MQFPNLHVNKVVLGALENGVQLLSVPDVPVEAGSPRVRYLVFASNDEGECTQPAMTPLIEMAEVRPPAEIEFLEPGQNLAASRSRIPARIAIASKAAHERGSGCR